ncbi:M48 family metallopeptidase [Candidatus Saccharibacteria bacterium]|nr:M48 family metallopeptidase [Candidatus Saccharibacteria bacterium]
MPSPESITDAEFGTIQVKRIATAKYLRVRPTPAGELVVTAPKRALKRDILSLINNARLKIRDLLEQQTERAPAWQHGSRISERHILEIIPDERISTVKTFARQGVISVRYPRGTSRSDLQEHIHKAIKKALKAEAMQYLPERIHGFAREYGFSFERLRYSTANGRWGSCSTSGTISLNIWLMSLPYDLIDYVLIHELAHTRQMNHSPAFWGIVRRCLPDYAERKKTLAKYSPQN